MTLTWDYTTYEFNHYFGQRHLADRFLLLAFAVGTLHRPVMAIPFVVVATMILHQFHYPLSLFLSAADDSVLHVMLFFAAALLLTLVTRQDFMAAFLFLALCRVAANYWWPGRTNCDWLGFCIRIRT